MVTAAEFTVSSDEFPLGSIFDGLSGVSVEIERVIPTNSRLLPYFWVRGGDAESLLELFHDDSAIRRIELVDEVEGHGSLFRGEWNTSVEGIITGIANFDITLLSAKGNETEWIFQFRAEDRAAFAGFQRYCTEQDLHVELTWVRSLSEMATGNEYGLTSEQHEALVLVFDRGYFDEPRRASLEEIANELDITRQSLAGRLRRAHRNLVEHTLVHG